MRVSKILSCITTSLLNNVIPLRVAPVASGLVGPIAVELVAVPAVDQAVVLVAADLVAAPVAARGWRSLPQSHRNWD